jgi:catechol 2,3-dioxygenase-like lactoylglutathione lyase family enzyme
MVKRLWNYAVKAPDIQQATEFYEKYLGAEFRLRGEVFGCKYNVVKIAEMRILIFDKAPYEESMGMNLPPGFLHAVYEVDDFEATVENLRNSGVRILMEPQLIHAAFGVRKICFFEAPDGVRTEVMQIIEDSPNV